MKTERVVTIRDRKIGEGMPKICVPIVGADEKEIRAQAERIRELPADMAEWRMDCFDGVDEPDSVRSVLGTLRAILPWTPLLATFRTRKEGGNRDITAEGYRKLCAAAAEGGCDLIDVELFAGSTLPWETDAVRDGDTFFRELVETAHRCGVKAVGSSHEFHRTPKEQEILFRLCRMQALGADIVKIAVMPQRPEDVDVLLGATIRMCREYAAVPVVTMAMGEEGTVSRINGELTGSAITFGSAGRASAPGQIPVRDLKRALEMIHEKETGRKQEDSRAAGRKKNLYLIGFMGTGKSSVSGELSKRLGYRELDTDEWIEQQQGTTIFAIFEQKGEACFREMETECLRSLGKLDGTIVSCGGGMAVRQENVALMKENGVVVLLTAEPETILERVRDDDSRPILRGNKTVPFIAQLMERRRAAYEAAADITVATDRKSVGEVAEEICARMEDFV